MDPWGKCEIVGSSDPGSKIRPARERNLSFHDSIITTSQQQWVGLLIIFYDAVNVRLIGGSRKKAFKFLWIHCEQAIIS